MINCQNYGEKIHHLPNQTVSVSEGSIFSLECGRNISFFFSPLTMQEKAEGESPEKPAMGPGSLRSLFTDVSQQMMVAMGGVSVGVREVLNKVLGILDQGLRDITKARDTVIDTRKRNIADISWIKVRRQPVFIKS